MSFSASLRILENRLVVFWQSLHLLWCGYPSLLECNQALCFPEKLRIWHYLFFFQKLGMRHLISNYQTIEVDWVNQGFRTEVLAFVFFYNWSEGRERDWEMENCPKLWAQGVAGDQNFAAKNWLKECCMFYSNLRWESEEGGDIRHDPGNKMASFTFKIHILISANVFYLLVIKQNYAIAIGFKVT